VAVVIPAGIVSAGTTFLQAKNSAVGELASSIGADDTTCTITGGGTFPTAYPYHAVIGGTEIVEVTSLGTEGEGEGEAITALTITRGAESTSHTSHDAGASFKLNVTAQYVSELQTAVNGVEDALSSIATTGIDITTPIETTDTITAANVAVTGNISVVGTVDGVDISATSHSNLSYINYINQNLATTATPSFVSLWVGSGQTSFSNYIAGSHNENYIAVGNPSSTRGLSANLGVSSPGAAWFCIAPHTCNGVNADQSIVFFGAQSTVTSTANALFWICPPGSNNYSFSVDAKTGSTINGYSLKLKNIADSTHKAEITLDTVGSIDSSGTLNIASNYIALVPGSNSTSRQTLTTSYSSSEVKYTTALTQDALNIGNNGSTGSVRLSEKTYINSTGTGAPAADANAPAGAFAFRSDGIYQKRSGVWVKITS